MHHTSGLKEKMMKFPPLTGLSMMIQKKRGKRKKEKGKKERKKEFVERKEKGRRKEKRKNGGFCDAPNSAQGVKRGCHFFYL